MLPIAFVTLLVACTDASSDSKEGPPGDTGGDSGTDSGTDSDSAVDTDTDTGTGAATATFVLDGDWEGTTLSLTEVEPGTIPSGLPAFGSSLAATPASATTTIDLAVPAELVEIDPVDHPGVKVAWLVPALHLDTDGDDAPSELEGYLGAGLTWIVYVEGSPEGIAALPDAVEGWNALNRDVTTNSFTSAGDLAAVPLSASLAVDDSLTMSGTWTDDIPENTGIALLSRVSSTGGTVDEAHLYDAPATTPWTISVSGAPPVDHFEVFSNGVGAAAEIALTYTDVDGSGDLNKKDDALYGICAKTQPVGLVYYTLVPTLDLALRLVAAGNPAGWSGLALNSGGEGIVANSELSTLTTGPGCELPTD